MKDGRVAPAAPVIRYPLTVKSSSDFSEKYITRLERTMKNDVGVDPQDARSLSFTPEQTVLFTSRSLPVCSIIVLPFCQDPLVSSPADQLLLPLSLAFLMTAAALLPKIEQLSLCSLFLSLVHSNSRSPNLSDDSLDALIIFSFLSTLWIYGTVMYGQ
jgi:hypothetical protein